jgi:hypothetical protein
MRQFILLVVLCAFAAAETAQAAPKVGVISYWGTDAWLYDRIPDGSVAVINPDNGIFVSAGQTETVVPNLAKFKKIVKRAAQRNVKMLGYVETGYFDHACNTPGQCQTLARIDAQVAAYFADMPGVQGIFFDEAAPTVWNCGAFPAEYQTLRAIVRKYSADATIAFNAGVPDNCAVSGAIAGEILVLFENAESAYVAQAVNVQASTLTALNKGVVPWHLIDTVTSVGDLHTVFAQAASTDVGLLYMTDLSGDWQAGVNTWGSLPSFWAEELALFSSAEAGAAPLCSALAGNPSGQSFVPVMLSDIGQLGYVHLITRDWRGHIYAFDGLHWNQVSGGAASTFTSITLGGVLTLSNQTVATMLAVMPPNTGSIWFSYSVPAESHEPRGRMQVCRAG